MFWVVCDNAERFEPNPIKIHTIENYCFTKDGNNVKVTA